MVEELGLRARLEVCVKMEVMRCGKSWPDISWSFRSVLYVACMASVWSTVVSAQAAAPPTDPSSYNACSRDLVTTVWGFILTLVALTVDDSGTLKNNAEDKLKKRT